MRSTTRSNVFLAAFSVSAVVAAVTLGKLMADAQDALTPAAAYARTGRALGELWQAPKFEGVSQDGVLMSERDLHGHVWVASFLFTSCSSVCPMLAGKLTTLQRQLTAPSLRFVSFSVDPARDTPARLAAFARRFRPDPEPRWLLLSPKQTELGSLLRSMHLAPADGDGEPSSIAHSSLLFLIDRDGVVRGVYDAADDGGASMSTLERDAQELLGTPRTRSMANVARSLSPL